MEKLSDLTEPYYKEAYSCLAVTLAKLFFLAFESLGYWWILLAVGKIWNCTWGDTKIKLGFLNPIFNFLEDKHRGELGLLTFNTFYVDFLSGLVHSPVQEMFSVPNISDGILW